MVKKQLDKFYQGLQEYLKEGEQAAPQDEQAAPQDPEAAPHDGETPPKDEEVAQVDDVGVTGDKSLQEADDTAIEEVGLEHRVIYKN